MAAVVLGPIAICVFIFLVALGVYTCYKNRESAQRQSVGRISPLDASRVNLSDSGSMSPFGNVQYDHEYTMNVFKDELRTDHLQSTFDPDDDPVCVRLEERSFLPVSSF